MESVMDRTAVFRDHIDEVSRRTAAAIAAFCERGDDRIDGIVFHAGSAQNYHGDDQQMPFRSTPHFLRFAPVPGPDHLLLFRPGSAVKLIRVVPSDYWYEPPVRPDHPFPEVLDVVEVDSVDAAVAAAGDVKRCAYFGNSPAMAAKLGIPESMVEPDLLRALVDWERGAKTAYEVDCIREASRITAAGHIAVREAGSVGATERELQSVYLAATGALENDTPYGTIIGWDEHAATLHYESKSMEPPRHGNSLLIDAGSTCHGYASDVTRTYTYGKAPAEFDTALDMMDDLERSLVESVAPGVSFVDLHIAAHRGVAGILHAIGASSLSAEELHERGLTQPFLPHGLGHHLGLQVHDVGGRQVTPDGKVQDPPEQYPFLRTTRELAVGHVVTIEPGIYFIPILLDPFRAEHPDEFDWDLIDRLVPCGGIRIEDDILVTESGFDDLTRHLIPGHRDATDGGR